MSDEMKTFSARGRIMKVILAIGWVMFAFAQLWLTNYSKECYDNGYKECINANSWIEVYNILGPISVIIFIPFVIFMHIRIDRVAEAHENIHR